MVCVSVRALMCVWQGGGASPGALPAPLTSQLARVFTPVLLCSEPLSLSFPP